MGLTRYSVPKYPFNVPFWIYDLTNNQLITSALIPDDISDTKPIILVETPIPGLNYQPIMPSGAGNRKVGFTLPLIRRNNTVGNVLILKMFDTLRNQALPFLSTERAQFVPTPKVLFQWGIGSVPLVWWVAKCDATHKAGWTNAAGLPQYSELSIELILDEEHPLYTAEVMYRQVSAIAGQALTGVEQLGLIGGRPY